MDDALVTGDVNNDGLIDLIQGSYSTSKGDEFFLNNGTSTPYSNPPIIFATGLNAVDYALGDVDNDGDLDLVEATYNSDATKLYINDGDNTPFSNGSTALVSGTPSGSSIDLYDFNKDGYLDVIIGTTSISGTGGEHAVVLNNQTSTPFLNVVPIAAQFQTEILPLINPELTKEMGIKVTSQSRGMSRK